MRHQPRKGTSAKSTSTGKVPTSAALRTRRKIGKDKRLKDEEVRSRFQKQAAPRLYDDERTHPEPKGSFTDRVRSFPFGTNAATVARPRRSQLLSSTSVIEFALGAFIGLCLGALVGHRLVKRPTPTNLPAKAPARKAAAPKPKPRLLDGRDPYAEIPVILPAPTHDDAWLTSRDYRAWARINHVPDSVVGAFQRGRK